MTIDKRSGMQEGMHYCILGAEVLGFTKKKKKTKMDIAQSLSPKGMFEPPY